jgi:hypothetical protein
MFGFSSDCHTSCFLHSNTGLPHGLFQIKNPNLGKFWRALEWKMLAYFMAIWNILHPFGIIYGRLVWFMVIWYISQFDMFGLRKNLPTLF